MYDPGDDRDCDEAAEGYIHAEFGCWADPGSNLAGLAAEPPERLAKRVHDLLWHWSQAPEKIAQCTGDGVEGSDDCLNHGWRLRRHKGQNSEHHCPTGHIHDHSNGRMDREEPVVEEKALLHPISPFQGLWEGFPRLTFPYIILYYDRSVKGNKMLDFRGFLA